MVKLGVGVISALGFLAFTAVCIIIVLFLANKLFQLRWYDTLTRFLRPYAYTLAFISALLATLASLFLSEVLHFQPCILCWYQRIAMYPQVILLYIAQIRRESVIAPYLIALNIVGGAISLYHYSLHVLPRTIVPILPCSRQLGGVPCDKGYDFYFGFMTFPLMAWAVFALITFFLIISSQKVVTNKTSNTKSRFRSRVRRKN